MTASNLYRFRVTTTKGTQAFLSATDEKDAKAIALRVLPKGTEIKSVHACRRLIVK